MKSRLFNNKFFYLKCKWKICARICIIEIHLINYFDHSHIPKNDQYSSFI